MWELNREISKNFNLFVFDFVFLGVHTFCRIFKSIRWLGIRYWSKIDYNGGRNAS